VYLAGRGPAGGTISEGEGVLSVQFNVATLLHDPIGSTRNFVLEDEPVVVREVGFETVATGRVRLLRTQEGVLVHAELVVPQTLECARCLTVFTAPAALTIDEEYRPLRDPATGEAVEADLDDFRLDAYQHLDLSEAVRQYGEAAMPIQPICREQCAGLCPVCGQNLNELRCGHDALNASADLSGLSALADRLRAEEERGSTEEADAAV
jgi:uncharacterized protein